MAHSEKLGTAAVPAWQGWRLATWPSHCCLQLPPLLQRQQAAWVQGVPSQPEAGQRQGRLLQQQQRLWPEQLQQRRPQRLTLSLPVKTQQKQAWQTRAPVLGGLMSQNLDLVLRLLMWQPEGVAALLLALPAPGLHLLVPGGQGLLQLQPVQGAEQECLGLVQQRQMLMKHVLFAPGPCLLPHLPAETWDPQRGWAG